MNTLSVDAYLKDGCGRCDKYQTTECKVHLWTDILKKLRSLLRASGLKEEMKWGSPCYTWNGKNVVMVASLNDACALSFFKGALLQADAEVLESPGPNSHHGRYVKFRSTEDWQQKHAAAERLIQEAIELEKAGKKIERPKTALSLPVELETRLAKNAKLKKAFDALTPGRQRSHVLHISSAKQSETRERRVEKCLEDILAGKGFNER